ncbi:MAG: HAD-IC family P-type ATPase [Gammaproteobacteria bacterium]|nr:HAD-IC family P-type ATPase [Gammaproteobacteria bacterium]
MPNSFDGLSDAEVQARRERGEANRVLEPVSRAGWEIVRANVLTRFNALLGSLFVVILAVGPWQDALFGGVLVINSLIGIIQELRAKRTLERLALLSQSEARVVRSGRIIEVPATEIVLDDVLDLAPGNQILVDGVLLSANSLEVDESLLSGEAEPVPKLAGETVLSGSFAIAGNGRYRATRVGSAAYANSLAKEARHFTLAHSGLRAGINRMLRYVTWAIVPTALLLFGSQVIAQTHLAGALLFSAAGVVAMVPEGLVLLTSAALALGAIRLARRKTLVQDLPATETLARVDVICLDKTGTLTEREPEIEHVELLAAHPGALNALAALAATDPNPNATLRAIGRTYPNARGVVSTGLVPFSSVRKWSGATLDELGAWVIGAPEVLLANIPGSETARARAENHARAGRRVLLLASTDSELAPDRLPPDLVPVALVLLAERLRADTAETLRYFAEQGITVKVISGDHPGTVSQVAMKVGVADAAAPVDARQLPENSAALSDLVETRTVFNRASPQEKRSIIAALQARNHVVAMVGDGINDILALKQADVGIAMGAGTGAARAVSQLVLLDNRFANLPFVVAEGRRVIGNVERLAVLFLTKTVYAMLLAFAAGIADVTFPFLPRHLTLVGSLTIGIPAFFLSLEFNAERARPGFVERVLRFAVPAGLVAALATFAAYALVNGYLAGSANEARTAATVVLFSIASWVLAILVRPLGPARLLLIGAMLAAFATVLAVPPLRAFFALELLPAGAWFAVAGIAIAAGAALHRSSQAAARSRPELARGRRFQWKEILAWLISRESPKWFLVSAALLILGGAWLFFGVLEDVLSHDPLVEVDVIVYGLLQKLRTPAVDSLMVAITELGDVQVLLPVILVALAWFIAHRLWHTAGYWLAAIGVAEALVKVLKLTLHRPRPGPFYGGVEQFSFPSSHATLSIVVYGFLAFLLCRGEQHRLRKAFALATALLIALIAFSRLYLGAHWLSDVLGDLSFGVAWVAALAVAYEYQSYEKLKPRRLAAVMLATLAIAGTVHIATDHAVDLERYAYQPVPVEKWRSGGALTPP